MSKKRGFPQLRKFIRLCYHQIVQKQGLSGDPNFVNHEDELSHKLDDFQDKVRISKSRNRNHTSHNQTQIPRGVAARYVIRSKTHRARRRRYSDSNIN
jgi:hypothetical protein